MRMHWEILALLYIASFAHVPSVGPPRSPQVVALIFADVTSSLNRGESEQIANIAASAFDELPGGSQAALFPIHMDMESPSPILRPSYIPMDPDTRSALVGPRHNIIKKKVAELYDVINHPQVKSDGRTCILDALVFAGNYFQNNTIAGDKRLLIFASDMLEECAMTPLRKPIHLNKIDIMSEIKAATAFPEIQGLSGVQILVVLPANPTPEKFHHTRPRMEALRKFWDAIFFAAGRNCAIRPNITWSIGQLPQGYVSDLD